MEIVNGGYRGCRDGLQKVDILNINTFMYGHYIDIYLLQHLKTIVNIYQIKMGMLTIPIHHSYYIVIFALNISIYAFDNLMNSFSLTPSLFAASATDKSLSFTISIKTLSIPCFIPCCMPSALPFS